MRGMKTRVLVGTADGLWACEPAGSRPAEALVGRTITALAGQGTRTWAIVDGRTLWAGNGDGAWKVGASIKGAPATCLNATARRLVVGTERAHLLRLTAGRLVPVESFDRVEGRKAWYTPWGDPADVRSIAAESARIIYVNVHVGGVVRTRDGGGTWTPTLDIEKDVHQVVAHPTQPGVVVVAAAVGLGVSRDGGVSWQFVTRGLHARYSRAVAVSEDTVLVTTSSGPGGKRAAIYRMPLAGGAELERCRRGLPEWFDGNIDTACLATRGPRVAFGTEDGRVFYSADGGTSWDVLAKGLPPVHCILVD